MAEGLDLLPRRRAAIGPGPSTVPDIRVRLSEAAPLGKLSIRGDVSDAGFVAAMADATGVPPPARAHVAAAEGKVAVLWLGPDEWLAVSPPGDLDPVRRRLAEALPAFAAVVDVTDALAMVHLAGAEARSVLAKLCPLDLRPETLPVGRAVRTLVAGMDVIVQPVGDEEPDYRLFVARSSAESLWNTLLDAAEEYGVAVDA